MKYEEWLKEWLKNYVKISAKQRTVTRYKEILNKHIIPSLGEYELRSLSPIILQKYVSKLMECGNQKTGGALSSSSVNSIITVIQGSLAIVHSLGLTENNPASYIKRPKLTEKKVECFSVVEQRRIEQAVYADKRLYMKGIIICLYTGLRIGELLALTWRDIDFVNSMLFVNKTCYDGKDNDGNFGRIVDVPKTQSSYRAIPLSKPILSLMKDIRKQCNVEWVLTNNGNPLSVRTFQRNFAALLKKLNISHRGFHALRHTFATRAIECGVDVKTLSEILGHKNATITLNRYAHSLLEHKRDMMNRLGKLCGLSQN